MNVTIEKSICANGETYEWKLKVGDNTVNSLFSSEKDERVVIKSLLKTFLFPEGYNQYEDPTGRV